MSVVCSFAGTTNITSSNLRLSPTTRYEFLNTDDQSVISQFERWWDKYRVSLHELDAEVKQSEEVMRGYLKELGHVS